MQYALTFHETAEDFAHRTDAAAPQFMAGWMAYIQAMRDSGIMRAGAGLQPPATATSVRLRNGKRQVHDGPFADSKEQLGGFVLIEVADLDAALEWAARAPCAATGGVEVRPVLPPPNPN